MSEKVVQILSRASKSVLTAVHEAVDGEVSLKVLSESALSHVDRTVLKSLLVECRESGLDFARGVAAGLLAKVDGSEVKLVVSAPFRTEDRQTGGVIAELIGSSTRTLEVCSFVLVYLDELVPLFRSATERGVLIRVLLDFEAGHARSVSSTVSLLSPILGPDSLRFWHSSTQDGESLHAKFLVADGARALVTSANMTGRAITRNVEAGLYTDDPDAVLGLSKLFTALWMSESPLLV